MNKHLILCVLAAIAAFPQAQTPLTITQSAGSATGEIRMQERRTNGTDYVGLKAPQSVAASTVWTLPAADGTSGQCLQTDGAGVLSWAACGSGYATLHASDYDWSQTITAPGAAGTHTITLTPGPLGVIATDTASQYWLSGTAGADEYVASTGTGTCDGTGQASCTIEVTTANSHTGTTTLRSASAGAQEAINANTTSVTLLYGNEAVTWRACVYLNNHNVVFAGQGRGSSITLATPSQRGICKLTAGYLEVRNISIIGDGTTTGIYAQASVSNAGSDRIDSSFFQSHAKAINHRVVSETWITRNLFYGNTVDLETVNEVSNDQGGLVVSENNFLSDGTSSSKSVWYHGPGGAWFHKNAFTGARDSFYADGLMATVNTSGTAVTATDGRFYSGMVGGSYYINGVTYTVAAYVDSTHLTLSTSAGTQTGVAFGQSTGQFHFEDNNFDNQNRTGVWFDGAIYFGGVNLRGNTFSNFYGSEQYTAIKITNPAIDAVMIADNKFGNLAGTTFDHTGIYASYSGTNLSITGNTFLAHKYSINLDFGGTTNATDTLISGNTFKGGAESGTVAVRMRNALRATLAANSIYNYITGVDIAGASSAEITVVGGKITCPASGTGIAVDAATGVSINAVDFGTACTTMTALSGGATVSSNAATGTPTNRYTASGSSTIRDNAPESATILSTGTNDTAAIGSIARYTTGTAAANFGVQQSITLENASGSGITAGGWQFRWADASNMYPQYDFLISKNNGGLVIGASLDTNKNWISYGSLYSSIGSVTGRFGADLNSGAGIGTFSAHPLSLYTDSAARWVVTSAGNFQPQVDDTYDLGTSTVSPNAIYSHGFSAIATSSDYVRARKIEHHMDGTGSAFFSWSFASSNVLDLLDTSSGVIAKYDLNTSDISFAGNVWPRGTTETRNLGLTTARWLAVNAKNLNLSGNVTSNLTPSGTRDLGGTGAEWNGLYAGSAVITSIIEPKVSGGAQSGDSTKRWSNTYSVDGNYSGTLTTASLTINTSSAPAVGDVWTATSTGGAGSWQTPTAGTAPFIDSAAIIKGSADATKLLKIEVDGFTTATTRTLTPQNASYTIAGTDIAQTFTQAQTVSLNGSTPTAPTGTVMHVIQANSTGGRIAIDTAAAIPAFVGRRAQGTIASPTALTSGNAMFQFGAFGYGTTGYSSTAKAGMTIFAAENWSDTAQGTKLTLFTTPNGTTTETAAWDISNAGHFLASTDNTVDIGANGANRPRKIWTNDISVSGTGTIGTLIVNTSTLTPQAANYTLAGTNLSQTFSNTQTFSGTLSVSGTIGDDFIPNADGTYVNGTTSFRWGSIATYNADFNGVLTLQSGSTITGSILPTTNNLYALGNTSFRWSTIVTTNANISGTITAPSGSTGVSATKTVRDSAGTGTCTLIFSGGLLTGGTC